MSDRVCIASKGGQNFLLSPQDMVSWYCLAVFLMLSQFLTFKYFVAAILKILDAKVPQNLPSSLLSLSFSRQIAGGYLLYAWQYMASHGLASEDCIPYASGSGHPPSCPSKCADNSTITRTSASMSSVAYSGNATQLQLEILTNGPIQV